MTSDWVKVGTNKIHRTAIIENSNLGKFNTVGPYSVIRNAEIGDHNVFTAFCAVGEDPEIRNFEGAAKKIWIGDRNVFREFVTVNCGQKELTKIGSDCLFFQKSHVSHDAEVGNHVTVCGQSCVGGHCLVQDYVTLGGDVHMHQFTVIGFGAMVGQGAMITRHVKPFMKLAAREAHFVGENDYLIQKQKWTPAFLIEKKAQFEKKLLWEILKDDRKRRTVHESDEGLIQGSRDQPEDRDR